MLFCTVCIYSSAGGWRPSLLWSVRFWEPALMHLKSFKTQSQRGSGLSSLARTPNRSPRPTPFTYLWPHVLLDMIFTLLQGLTLRDRMTLCKERVRLLLYKKLPIVPEYSRPVFIFSEGCVYSGRTKSLKSKLSSPGRTHPHDSYFMTSL